MNIEQLVVTFAPTVIGLVERLFSKKPKSGPQKKALVLNIIQTAIAGAIGIDSGAFGAPEQELISEVNDAVVKYYNAKGWPTS